MMAYYPQVTYYICDNCKHDEGGVEGDEVQLIAERAIFEPTPEPMITRPGLSETSESRAEPAVKLQRQSELSYICDLLKNKLDLTMDQLFHVHKQKLADETTGQEPGTKRRKLSGDSQSTSISSKSKDRIVDKSGGGQPKQSSLDKFTTLQAALADILKDGESENTLEAIGEENYKKIIGLQQSIIKHNRQTAGISLGDSQSHDHATNFPKLFSGHGLPITPWRSSEIPSVLPELPKILDKALEVAAFTHAGSGFGYITDLNYERLEWIGDGYIELTATLLISQTFSSFSPGQATHLREQLVKNVTLARYAQEYGFDKLAKLPDVFTGAGVGPQTKEEKRIKALGDIFEAYVAAVVLSDPKFGLSRATQWLKEIWSMDIATKIVQEEKTRNPNFKNPIWHLGQNATVVDQPDPSVTPAGPKMQLSRALGCKGIKINYKDAAPETKDKTNNLPVFTVGVYIDGWGEKNKQLGVGKAHGKKEAGAKAAENALANKKLMKVYMDKKAVYEAQQKAEAEALNNAGGS